MKRKLFLCSLIFFFSFSAAVHAQEGETSKKVLLGPSVIPKDLSPHYELSFHYGNSSQNSSNYSYRFSFIDPASIIKFDLEGKSHPANPASTVGVEPLNLNDYSIILRNWLIAPEDNVINIGPRLGYRWVNGQSTGFSDSMNFFFYGVQFQWILYPGATSLLFSYDNANVDPTLSLNRYEIAMKYRISYNFTVEVGYLIAQYPQTFGFSRPISSSVVTSDDYFVGLDYAF